MQALILGVLLGACTPLATKGTLPPPGPNGQVDPSALPDFISVAGAYGGIVGYVRNEAVLPPASPGVGRPPELAWPVYADDLTTVVGHLVPGKGFVPSGVDPASLPSVPVEQRPGASNVTAGDDVVAYVRNATAGEAWIGVASAGVITSAIGFAGSTNVGVGCFAVTPGHRLVLVDRPPDRTGALIVDTIVTGASTAEASIVWIDISSDGRVVHGTGVPSWWEGGTPAC